MLTSGGVGPTHDDVTFEGAKNIFSIDSGFFTAAKNLGESYFFSFEISSNFESNFLGKTEGYLGRVWWIHL